MFKFFDTNRTSALDKQTERAHKARAFLSQIVPKRLHLQQQRPTLIWQHTARMLNQLHTVSKRPATEHSVSSALTEQPPHRTQHRHSLRKIVINS